MEKSATKLLVLAGATIIVFSVVVAIGLRLVPEPHNETDFLVIGSVATLFALGALFTVLITTVIGKGPVFFKRRRATPPAEDQAPSEPQGEQPPNPE